MQPLPSVQTEPGPHPEAVFGAKAQPRNPHQCLHTPGATCAPVGAPGTIPHVGASVCGGSSGLAPRPMTFVLWLAITW